MIELVRKSFAFEARSDGQAQGIVRGYASTYQKDAYGDRIAPGAFGESIKEKRGRYPVLWGHDPGALIGFTTKAAEDHKGLDVEALLALGNSTGRDAYELVKTAEAAGSTMGLSIGFITRQWEMDDDVRTLTDVDLIEISLTAFPANRGARIEEARSRSGIHATALLALQNEIRAARLRVALESLKGGM